MEPSTTPKKRGRLLVSTIAVTTLLAGTLAATSVESSASAVKHPAVVVQQIKVAPQQLVGATTPLKQPAAAAPVVLRLRQHRSIGGYPAGYYSGVFGGKTYWLICLFITGRVPAVKTLKTLPTIGNVIFASGKKAYVSPTKTAALMALEKMVSSKDSASRAEVMYLAANRIGGIDKSNFDRLMWKKVSSKVRGAAQKIIDHVMAHHGKSAVNLKLTRAPKYVGDTGSVTLTVLNNSSGKKVTFTGHGATMLTSVRHTNSKNQATASFVATSTMGTITAKAEGLNPITITVNSRTQYEQIMITKSPATNLSDHVPFKAQRTKLIAECSTPCDGTNVVVSGAKWHNPTGSTATVNTTAQRVVKGKTVTVNYGNVSVSAHKSVAPAWNKANDRDTNLVETITITVGGVKHSFVVATLKLVDCPPAMEFQDGHTVKCTGCTTHVITPLGTNPAKVTVTFTYSITIESGSRKGTELHGSFSVPSGQSHAPVTIAVNASQYTYKVIESVPFATSGKAPRTITDSATVTVS